MGPKVEYKSVWKLFADNPDEALRFATENGLDKESLFSRCRSVLAVADVSFTVPAGERFVIMGLSGSGKSTLIRHVNRLIEPTTGQVLIDGEDVGAFGQDRLRHLRAHKIGMVFQQTALLPHLTARENVALGLEFQRIPRVQRLEIADEALRTVQIGGWGDRYPHELSGGMRQRVGLARALATDPDILVMDEPFSALDPLIRRQLQDMFLRLSKEMDKTTLFITHDVDEAIRLGTRIAIMRDGRIVQIGTPEEIVTSPADDYIATFVRDISRLHYVSARAVMEPIESDRAARPVDLDGWPHAAVDSDLDGLIDLAAKSDQPIVIVENDEPVGIVTHRGLLRGLQGDRSPVDRSREVRSDGPVSQVAPSQAGDTSKPPPENPTSPVERANLNWSATLLGPVWSAAHGFWGLFCGVALTDALALVLIGRALTTVGNTSSLVVGVATLAGARWAVGMLAGRAGQTFRRERSGPGHERRKWSRLSIGMVIVSLIYSLTYYRFCVGELPAHLGKFPAARTLPLDTAEVIDKSIDWLAESFEGVFEGITRSVRAVLEFLEVVLIDTPWPVVFLVLLIMCGRAGGGRAVLFTAAALTYLGVFGFWNDAMSTLALVLAATLLCVLIGTPLGILSARSQRARGILTPLLDLMQTMPSFVYLIPAVAFFRIGKPPGVLATVVFAMPSMIRLTALGIQQVSPSIKEAALAFGASPRQMLTRVELPLALPSILAGVNQTIMMSLSMVVVAALIGAGGLGNKVVRSLDRLETGQGILAGLAIVFCAMILDRIARGIRPPLRTSE